MCLGLTFCLTYDRESANGESHIFAQFVDSPSSGFWPDGSRDGRGFGNSQVDVNRYARMWHTESGPDAGQTFPNAVMEEWRVTRSKVPRTGLGSSNGIIRKRPTLDRQFEDFGMRSDGLANGYLVIRPVRSRLITPYL
jgi:hypothetical protein